jgi:hypothetical protein
MNTSIASPPTSNLELLHKAVQEFRLNPRRVPFNNLKPLHESIVELRGKKASYAAIADLLKQNGVKTSRARVTEYGRIVLEGGKRRKRRKYARTTLAPIQTVPLAPKPLPQISVTNSLPPSPKSPYGPHIAKVELLPANELDY